MKELKLFVKLFGEMLYKCYLCNVFFIVLDFKVNKDWSKALLLFFVRTSTEPVHASGHWLNHSFHFQFKKQRAYPMDRNICFDDQCIDLYAFVHFLYGLYNLRFLFAQVREQLSLYNMLRFACPHLVPSHALDEIFSRKY